MRSNKNIQVDSLSLEIKKRKKEYQSRFCIIYEWFLFPREGISTERNKKKIDSEPEGRCRELRKRGWYSWKETGNERHSLSLLRWVCITGVDCVLLLKYFGLLSVYLSLPGTLITCHEWISWNISLSLSVSHCAFLFSIEAGGLSVSFLPLTFYLFLFDLQVSLIERHRGKDD